MISQTCLTIQEEAKIWQKVLVKTEINVIANKVRIMRFEDVDYIFLTDLARYADT